MSEVLEVIPGERIGPFRLGMTRAQLWKQHRSAVTCYFKTPTSTERTDNFTFVGVHLYYDRKGKCNFIEAMTRVQYNRVELLLLSVIINGSSVRRVRELCEPLVPSLRNEGWGFRSVTAGLGVYCHNYLVSVGKRAVSQVATTWNKWRHTVCTPIVPYGAAPTGFGQGSLQSFCAGTAVLVTEYRLGRRLTHCTLALALGRLAIRLVTHEQELAQGLEVAPHDT